MRRATISPHCRRSFGTRGRTFSGGHHPGHKPGRSYGLPITRCRLGQARLLLEQPAPFLLQVDAAMQLRARSR